MNVRVRADVPRLCNKGKLRQDFQDFYAVCGAIVARRGPNDGRKYGAFAKAALAPDTNASRFPDCALAAQQRHDLGM
jgi:hypothetical protein